MDCFGDFERDFESRDLDLERRDLERDLDADLERDLERERECRLERDDDLKKVESKLL